MGESEDERSDSDSDSASDSDDDRTDENDDALIDVWDGDPPLGTWTRRTWTWAPSLANWCVLPVRPRVFSSFPDPKARARGCIRARGPRLARIIARVHRAPRASSSRARTPRARPARRPPPPSGFLRNPLVVPRELSHPRASLGVRFSTLLLARLFLSNPTLRRILRILGDAEPFRDVGRHHRRPGGRG